MSTFTCTLNSGTSPANTMFFGGTTNTLVVTESSPPSNPFSGSTSVSLSYSTQGTTYGFSNVTITSSTTTTLTVTFKVSATSGVAGGGGVLQVTITGPSEYLTLQIPQDQ